MKAENCGACGTDSACLECAACDLYDERALHREVVRTLTSEIARLTKIEAAARAVVNAWDESRRTNGARTGGIDVLVALRESLSCPPYPTSAEGACHHPITMAASDYHREGTCGKCGVRMTLQWTPVPSPPPEVERGKCGECGGTGTDYSLRLGQEGVCMGCGGTGREGTK